MKCCASVHSESTGMHYHQCTREAVVGKYCRQHDPVAIALRDAARNEKWKAEWEAKQARWAAEVIDRKRADLCVAACSTLTDAGVSELGRRLSLSPNTVFNLNMTPAINCTKI